SGAQWATRWSFTMSTTAERATCARCTKDRRRLRERNGCCRSGFATGARPSAEFSGGGSPQRQTLLHPVCDILLEFGRAEGMGGLALADLAVFDELFRVDQHAPVLHREILQPVERPRRNAPPDGHRHIQRQAAPLTLVEQHHYPGVVRLHPV